VGQGALAPDQPAPRSDTPAPETAVTPPNNPAPAADPSELTPNVAADPNELKPNVDNGAQTSPPPTQVNELDPAANGQPAASDKTAAGASAPADDKDIEAAMSSSKHKKKKGLQKIIPF
jgi:hypothetical protein